MLNVTNTHSKQSTHAGMQHFWDTMWTHSVMHTVGHGHSRSWTHWAVDTSGRGHSGCKLSGMVPWHHKGSVPVVVSLHAVRC